MAYKLNVTEHADELLDNLVYQDVYKRQPFAGSICNGS